MILRQVRIQFLQLRFLLYALCSLIKKQDLKGPSSLEKQFRIYRRGMVATRYRCLGNKKNLLIVIPGLGQDLFSWSRMADYFSDKFTVIVFELPDFGRTSGLIKDWSVDNLADYVLSFLITLKWKKLILLGHSLGGKVCAKLSQKKQLHIGKLILYATKKVDFNRALPTYFIHGDNDLICPLASEKSLIILTNSTHLAHLDDPLMFIDTLNKIIDIK